jgi:MarR family transcriptional regulator, temperature-dependent positive regulator of motility
MAPAAIDLLTAPGHLIRRAQQRHQTLWSEMVGDRLTPVQFAVLTEVAAQPERDQRTLAVEISIDTSTLADVCTRLQERGLLERVRPPNDARRYVLRLTMDGRRVLDDTIPAVEAVGARLLAPLAPKERAALVALLRRLL